MASGPFPGPQPPASCGHGWFQSIFGAFPAPRPPAAYAGMAGSLNIFGAFPAPQPPAAYAGMAGCEFVSHACRTLPCLRQIRLAMPMATRPEPPPVMLGGGLHLASCRRFPSGALSLRLLFPDQGAAVWRVS